MTTFPELIKNEKDNARAKAAKRNPELFKDIAELEQKLDVLKKEGMKDVNAEIAEMEKDFALKKEKYAFYSVLLLFKNNEDFLKIPPAAIAWEGIEIDDGYVGPPPNGYSVSFHPSKNLEDKKYAKRVGDLLLKNKVVFTENPKSASVSRDEQNAEYESILKTIRSKDKDLDFVDVIYEKQIKQIDNLDVDWFNHSLKDMQNRMEGTVIEDKGKYDLQELKLQAAQLVASWHYKKEAPIKPVINTVPFEFKGPFGQ